MHRGRSGIVFFMCVFSVALGNVSNAEAQSSPNYVPVGTNLNGLSYSSTELPFLDSFKTAGAWTSYFEANPGDRRPLDLDERGWVRSLQPGQVAYTVLFHDTVKFSGSLARRYVVEHEGDGRLDYGELARLVRREDHRDIIEIETGHGNATITLSSTVPSNYIRNIRITPEGVNPQPGEIFNPIFLERLKGYRALRFMIWMLGDSADDIAARRWGERPVPQDALWTVKGAPVEVMVALANRAEADPWFTIPHAADDDYVRRFAELVATSLAPGRKVYLEYSNEVWNSVYPQTAYARQQGLTLGLSQDPDEALLRFYAKRAVEIFTIWERYFPRERLVRVLSFQTDGMPERSDEIPLSFGDTRNHVDALSIGPYFGTDLAADAASVAQTRRLSLNELMQVLESRSLPNAKAQMLAHAAVARRYGLPMIAYEGGQHLWNMSGQAAPELDALFTAANRDPRMGALYSRYLNDWAEAGGGLFTHLLDCGSFEGAGNWGALEYITQPRAQAPKYDAIQRFIEDQSRLRIGDASVAEGSAVNAVFRVALSAASMQTVTVAYATANDTALAGSDYAATSGTLTFTPGRTAHAVFVPILADAALEGTETFSVALSRPTNATILDGVAQGTISDPPGAADIPMYRAYNPNAFYHFFTTSQGEFLTAVAAGYRDESNAPCCTIPFKVPNLAGTGKAAIFRMYNPNNGRHYYTASAGERDVLMGVGWVYEKDEGFVYASQQGGTVEVFRLYNSNSGVHLYTVRPEEKDAILAQFPGIWFQHASLGFAVP